MEVALRALRRFAVRCGEEEGDARLRAAAASAAVVTASSAVAVDPCLVGRDAPSAPSHPGAVGRTTWPAMVGGSWEAGGGQAGGVVVSELYTWGQATNYQLGFGAHLDTQPVPRLVTLPKQVRSVACGRLHSVAVAACGSVFCWGVGGTTGRLGVGAIDGGVPSPFIVEPTALPEFGVGRHVAVKAAAGLSHTLALTVDGRVLAWGSNSHGQLGVQGLPTGCDAHAVRPLPVKGALRGEAVSDVAAGAEHSLALAAGGIFTWGSNAGGGLGLGVPPAGPAEAAQPRQLPHLRGARSVAASAMSGHVSIVIAAHGEAMIFGVPLATAPNGALPGGAVTSSGGGAAKGRSGAATAGAVETRQYVPTRIRFTGWKSCGDPADDEEWQTQRGGGSACMWPCVPLSSVALGPDDAFGIDANGAIWTWSLRGPRPCSADAVALTLSPQQPPASDAPAMISIAGCADNLWAVGCAADAPLWRLKRLPGESQVYLAERYEQVAQVTFIACGPEHQAAVVTYLRPREALPQITREKKCGHGGSDATGQDEEEDEEEEGKKEEVEEKTVHAEQESACGGPGGGGRLLPSSHSPRRSPESLQQLCEDRLCRALSPRSFALLCEIAWEFRRPLLLDRAFAFLRANASLMFSRQHLAMLAQVPFEVFCAFELVMSGSLTMPSAALQVDPWSFPPEDMRATPGADPAATVSVEAGVGQGPVCRFRRRRRSGGICSGGSLSKASSPMMSPLQGCSPKQQVASGGPQSLADGPALRKRGGNMIIGSPSGAAVAPTVMSTAWVEVKNRRKVGSLSCEGGGASPGVGTPKISPLAGQALAPPEVVAQPVELPKRSNSAMMVPLADLVRSKTSTPKGVSAALASAVQAAQMASPKWVVSDGPPEAPVSLRKIIEEAKDSSGMSTPGSDGVVRICTAAGSGQRGSVEDTATDVTRCSWGSDSMPSMRARGPSVYEAQREEKTEISRRKEDEEIREIEAMFAALEVAEREEARERDGVVMEEEGNAAIGDITASASSSQDGTAAAFIAQPSDTVNAGGGRGGRSLQRPVPRPRRLEAEWTEAEWAKWDGRRHGWGSSGRWSVAAAGGGGGAACGGDRRGCARPARMHEGGWSWRGGRGIGWGARGGRWDGGYGAAGNGQRDEDEGHRWVSKEQRNAVAGESAAGAEGATCAVADSDEVAGIDE